MGIEAGNGIIVNTKIDIVLEFPSHFRLHLKFRFELNFTTKLNLVWWMGCYGTYNVKPSKAGSWNVGNGAMRLAWVAARSTLAPRLEVPKGFCRYSAEERQIQCFHLSPRISRLKLPLLGRLVVLQSIEEPGETKNPTGLPGYTYYTREQQYDKREGEHRFLHVTWRISKQEYRISSSTGPASSLYRPSRRKGASKAAP